MNSIFSIKSSIALLVLGAAMLAAPRQPVESTLEAFSVYQPAIAASAVGAIAETMQYEII